MRADLNGDGTVNNFDVDPFIAALTAGGGGVVYEWDAENRLAAVEPASTPQNGDKRVEFTYDYLGRRVQKQVFTWDDGTEQWDLTLTRRFVWSGWLMLMELDGSNNAVRKYTCGLDLAGQSGGQTSGLSALESAGGIGGVLAVHDASSSEDYVYCYDANGNVGQLVAYSADVLDDGQPPQALGTAWHVNRLVARYEYDPYGAIVGPDTDDDGDFDENDEPGTYAAANPIRFSTKYWDDETGLGSWPIRYYDPRLGRWISRDPIGEAGATGVYTYASNTTPKYIDPLGLTAGAPGNNSPSPSTKPPASTLAQKTCGPGWEPVPGDDGKVGVDENPHYSGWVRIGENSVFDQLWNFRYLVQWGRTKTYWKQQAFVTEVSDCGANLNSSISLTFDNRAKWTVGGSFSINIYKTISLGLNVRREVNTGPPPVTITLHFDEGESCYWYKGYVFARAIDYQKSKFENPYTRAHQLDSSKTVGYTGEYKKLLCRKPCCGNNQASGENQAHTPN